MTESSRQMNTTDMNRNKIFHDIFLLHKDVMLLIDPKTNLIIEANLSAERFTVTPVTHS